jgi:hypothetical protein
MTMRKLHVQFVEHAIEFALTRVAKGLISDG